MLSSGIPTKAEYQRLQSEPLFLDIMRYSREFEKRCQTTSQPIRKYSTKWVKDPFLQWSRRWEYVYVAQRMLQWSATRSVPLKVVDAGSGFTFFPFYLLQTNTNLNIDCFDSDPTVGEALEEVSKILRIAPGFHIEDLEDLQQEDNSVDIIYSVSVIEHTSNPHKVIEEICRVLKPGGLFVCTFDISFETGSPMHVRHIGNLVAHIENLFEPSPDWTEIRFESLPTDEKIVSTQWIAKIAASTLPWRRPLLIWLYDLFRGRPRSTLYRPMTYCCGSFSKRSPK